MAKEIKYLDLAGLKALYGVVDGKITDAVNGLKNGATTGYDTLKGLEEKLKAEETRAQGKEKENADAIAAMDLTAVGGDGKFVQSVSQENGKVSAVAAELNAEAVKATAVSGADAVAVAEGTVASQITSLAKSLKTVEGNAAKYKVVKLTADEVTALNDANVKEAYKVVSYTGADTEGTVYTHVGEVIKIYKDANLENAELGTGADAQKLIFTYRLADGTQKTVKVDFAAIAFNTEFKNGLQVAENGEVSVKVDAASETFLTVSADGVKLAGVQGAINNTIATEIGKLDATIGEAAVAADKHVAVQVVETDGKITAVNVAEDDIASKAALEAEVTRATAAENKIEASVGLATDGSFVAPAGKNYISDATSVMNAIEKLDAQVKANANAGGTVNEDTQTVTLGDKGLQFIAFTKAEIEAAAKPETTNG